MKILGHHVYSPLFALAAVEFTLAAFAFTLSAWIFDIDEGRLFWAVSFGVVMTTSLMAVGLYQIRQRLQLEGVLARIVVGLGAAAISLALLDFVFPIGTGGAVWGASLVLALVFLSLTRIVLWRWVDHDAFRRRVLVYGAGQRAMSLLKLRRRSDQRGFRIAAFVPAPGDHDVLEDKRVIALDCPLPEFAQIREVDEIVVAMDDRRGGFPIAELLSCKFAGIDVVDLLGFLERETGKLKVDLVNPSWLIFDEGMSPSMPREIAARALDLVSGTLLLVMTLPFMLLVFIAIAIDDGFPVLYRQQRVGLKGRVFTLYKFRSMVKNAEADGRAQWAGTNDSRVLRIGKVIRKLRLDELPQIFNVIRGDMSLVGPRPERPEFVEQLAKKIPYYHERHCIKPGITGWAQLNYPYGSSDNDAMEKLQYDLYYIKHKSLIFDLVVLLQTAEVVLWGKGAR